MQALAVVPGGRAAAEVANEEAVVKEDVLADVAGELLVYA